MLNPVSKDLTKFDSFTDKGKEKIDQICRSATQVFSTKGYSIATLADVARAVGVSKGGIFYYFSTKEELLFVILCQYLDKTLDEVKRKLERIEDPHEIIRELIYHHVYHFVGHLHESRLILNEAQNLAPNYLRVVRNKEREYVGIFSEAVENLWRGRKKDGKRVRLATFTLLGMCNWPYRWFSPKGESSPKELAEEIYKIFVGELLIG